MKHHTTSSQLRVWNVYFICSTEISKLTWYCSPMVALILSGTLGSSREVDTFHEMVYYSNYKYEKCCKLQIRIKRSLLFSIDLNLVQKICRYKYKLFFFVPNNRLFSHRTGAAFMPNTFYFWISLSQSRSRRYTHLVCSQWQPRWRGLCQACFGPGHWIGMLSLALNQAPPSNRGFQARVWKASHVDLNAPSSACTGARIRGEWKGRKIKKYI